MASIENRLLAIERKIQRIIRKKVRGSDTIYHVQIGISSLDPEKVKYSLNIENLDGAIAPITVVLGTLEDLETAAKTLEDKIDRDSIEKAFVKSRIEIFERQLEDAKKTLAELEEIGYDAFVEKQTKEFEEKHKIDSDEAEGEE